MTTNVSEYDEIQVSHDENAIGDREKRERGSTGMKCLIEEDKRMIVGIFNTIRFKSKLNVADQLARELALLCMSEM